MIKAEFQKYGSYTTDSLYQWDLNQELQFVDTDISVAPVIHFCNRKSKESLLVQSTLTEGIITCPVPNVLLQDPFDIVAYIVSMEAQKATTLFKMLIPVNRRLKPSDYEYTDNIPILTYEAIQADIQHFFNLSKAEIAVERERINKIIVPETTFKNIAIRKFESKINDGSYIDETSGRVFGMSWVEQVNPIYNPNSYIFKNPFLLYAFGRGYDPNTGSWDDYVQITGDVRLKSNRLEVGVNFIDSDKIYTKAEMYAVVAYDNTVDNTELEDIRVGTDGKIHDSAGDAVRSQVGKLKEDISDLTDTIISIDKSNVSENVDNYENIESTIIKSNGKLESNSYTARFVVKKYINLTKASYTVKGFCQGNQCLYVLCDKNGDVIKYEDSTSQGSSGIKAVDITIDEQDTILYVGGYETIIAVVKKYLYDVKLTTRLSNIYRKKVTLNGDSIAFGAGTGGTGFMDYIASKYNMTLDKKAVSGATIANLSSRYPNKHCISTSIDTMAEDANYIIFEGGYNDWLLWTQIGTLTDTMSGDLDDTKFYGALESICRQALAKWENGKIGFIITHKINDAWRTQKQEGATYPTLDGYYQAIKNVCEKYSIPYLDLSKVSRLNTELQNYKKYTYNSDGVHPTEDGYQIFYVDTITKWMENL